MLNSDNYRYKSKKYELKSTFKVKVNDIKKALRMFKAVLPDELDSSYILFEIEDGYVKISSNASNHYISSKLKASNCITGSFAVEKEYFSKIRFPGKELLVEYNDKNNKIVKFKSGALKGEISSVIDYSIIKTKINKKIKFTHIFDYDSFIEGLKCLRFNPVDNNFKNRLKILLKEGILNISNIDNVYRGGVFKTKIKVDKNDNVLDESMYLDVLTSIIPFLEKDDDVSFGCFKGLMRIKNSTIDYQFPFISGKTIDIDKKIEEMINNTPLEYSFSVKCKDISKAINNVNYVLKFSKADDVKIIFKICDSEVKVTTYSKTAVGEYSLEINNTLKKNGKVATSSKVLSDLLLIEDNISFDFYESFIIIRSLERDLKYIIPKVKV